MLSKTIDVTYAQQLQLNVKSNERSLLKLFSVVWLCWNFILIQLEFMQKC